MEVPEIRVRIKESGIRWIAVVTLMSVAGGVVVPFFKPTTKTAEWTGAKILSIAIYLVLLIVLIVAWHVTKWIRLVAAVRAMEYMMCDRCGNDLRGLTRSDGVPIDGAGEAVATSDVVVCPECGKSHSLKTIEALWEGCEVTK